METTILLQEVVADLETLPADNLKPPPIPKPPKRSIAKNLGKAIPELQRLYSLNETYLNRIGSWKTALVLAGENKTIFLAGKRQTVQKVEAELPRLEGKQKIALASLEVLREGQYHGDQVMICDDWDVIVMKNGI